jgi:class 3 adenylate cyclase/phosphoserine phosphatase
VRNSPSTTTIRSDPESEQARKIIDFLLVMGTCHTVIPEKDDTGAIQYQAASPDEETLVVAARRLGVEFLSRSKKQVRFRVFGQVVDFEILNVNEFSSDRKRMSVVIRHPNGSLFLYAKGADDVIFNRLRDADKGLAEQTREHLSEFGSAGLRTLAIAQRKIDADVYAKWSDEYQKAANLLEDRDSQLHELAEQIESNLELLGASAIEDRLQDGVPDTICSLIDAGIKIWMLTGDKLETAINIGVSCQLLSSTTDLLRIDEDTFYQTSVKIANYLQNYQQYFGKKSDNMALIVSGASLHHILSDSNLSRVFLEICQSCRSVIACRLNPTQKASLVQLVKSASGEPLTLSVGDGANDVSMLQTAHIGVGIVGSEGMQAVRAADYALGQFRFLKRLLLVHGRWNHKRVSNLILYSFYKNITVVLSLFYFCFSNGFSGTTLYESWLGAGWNVGWTLVPIMLYGFLDQDLRAVTVLRNPEIYMGGQRKSEFSLWKMVQWQSNAVLHSIIIFVICQPATSSIYAPDGKNAGLILTGTIINCVTMLTVNLKMALHTNSWTSWNAIGIAGSILIWFAFTALYSSMIVGSQYDFYGIAKRLFVLPIFWLLITTVPLIACIVDICVLYVQRAFYPSPIDIAQELDANARESEKNSLLPTTSHVVLDGGEVVPTFSREVFDAEVTAENAAKSSETLISDHRAAAVSYHLSRLQAILSGNKGAASQKKEMLSQVLHLSQEVGMNWLTLSFQSGSEGGGELKIEDIESLEHEFQNQYVKKNLTFLRSAAAVIFVLMLCYSVFVTLSGGDSQLLARWIVTAAALVVMFFMWTRLFRAYFSEFLFIMMIVGGIGKTLMITSNGVSGLALYAIIVFLVLRSRFFTSLVAALVDLAFYDLYMGLQNIITGPQLGFIDFLQVCLVAFAALHGYRMERSYRVDFLLQKDYVSERARTQKIVDNMLPTYVTKKMKLNRGKNAVIANSGESVSIIFCDVVGFAHLSNIYSPQVLVSILDAVYSMFDELCEKHCVQKMETVGKTYMACAGLQGTRKDHALAAAEMAQEMIALAHSCVDLNGDVLEIRVGINTGRIISGVVGELRPQFSLFGDTVNTSSRMQSTGVVNRVHVSEATASLLRQDYRMEARQTPVKGKGILNTFLLDERTSNPMRSRRRSIVKLEDDMIDEVRRFSSFLACFACMFDFFVLFQIPKYVQKLALRELDHIDESESVEMNQFTLAFPIVENDDGEMIDYEAIYLEKRAERIDTEVRVPIVLAIIFFIVEALLEWQFSQDNLVSIFIIRFEFVCILVATTWWRLIV